MDEVKLGLQLRSKIPEDPMECLTYISTIYGIAHEMAECDETFNKALFFRGFGWCIEVREREIFARYNPSAMLKLCTAWSPEHAQIMVKKANAIK